jgi:glycosyltransferase involved in cell wall biosynthesis
MRVALVTGSYPPDICGVADYTEQLHLKLVAKGLDIVIFNVKRDGWIVLYKKLIKEKFDVIHMQYPTIGYGWSLLPQVFMFFFLGKKILTLHEFKERHFLRRLSMQFFKLSLNTRYVFTNEFELESFSKKNNSLVIPIGSNIPKANFNKVERESNSIVNFGLIRPDRGIEDFLLFAKRNKNEIFNFYLVGKVDSRFKDYFEIIKSECEKLNVKVILNLSSQAVSDFLSTMKFAYLPFPDGVSDRRGSLIASMLNDCVVVTQFGNYTTSELKACVVSVDDFEKINNVIHYDFENVLSMSRRYVTKFDWENVTEKHIELYGELTKND